MLKCLREHHGTSGLVLSKDYRQSFSDPWEPIPLSGKPASFAELPDVAFKAWLRASVGEVVIWRTHAELKS